MGAIRTSEVLWTQRQLKPHSSIVRWFFFVSLAGWTAILSYVDHNSRFSCHCFSCVEVWQCRKYIHIQTHVMFYDHMMCGSHCFDHMVTYSHASARSEALCLRVCPQLLHAATISPHSGVNQLYPELTTKDPCCTLLCVLTRSCDEFLPANNIILLAPPKKSHAEGEYVRCTGMQIPHFSSENAIKIFKYHHCLAIVLFISIVGV